MNIEMDPTPAPIDELIKDSEIACSIEESARRAETCKSCDRFYMDIDNHTKCSECKCNISLLISLQFKQCPFEKW